MRYFSKRILRLSATPHAIAGGVAAGVFVSFLPILGFHLILAAILAWCLAGNIVASALGTAFGNPLTYPLIWGATYELGHFILGADPVPGAMPPLHLAQALRHLDFVQLWEPLLKPMTVGAIPLGLCAALIVYGVTRWSTAAFAQRRHDRLAARLNRRHREGLGLVSRP